MASMQGYLHKLESSFYLKLVVRLLFYRTSLDGTTAITPEIMIGAERLSPSESPLGTLMIHGRYSINGKAYPPRSTPTLIASIGLEQFGTGVIGLDSLP